MNEPPPPVSLNVQDILFILLRHKWKIVACALLGLSAAAAFYFLTPPIYESRAKLLVRYVVERSAIDSVDSQSGGSVGRGGDSVINSEIEILTSWDLAAEVAEAVGIERLIPGSSGTASKAAAAKAIIGRLTVVSGRDSNVIQVVYRSPDPGLAATVLRELVNRYFNKHLEVHRSIGAFDFVTQQTDQVRGRLRQTEEELQKLKSKAGILSLADSTASISTSMTRCQDELLVAESALAEQHARVKEMDRLLALGGQPESSTDKQESSMERVGSGDYQRYQALVSRLSQLRSIELELLGRYAPENPLVRSTRNQIVNLDRQRQEMEERFPALIAAAPTTGQAAQPDIVSERARLAALIARVETLKNQLSEIRERVARFSKVGTQIAQLERRKEAEEEYYKYFESTLEKARIDEALDPSKIPNISMVQTPSPPLRVVGEKKKPVLVLAGGGFALGVGLAFLIELFLDRRVKRPLELETRLQIPLLLSIPRISKRERIRLSDGKDRKAVEIAEIAPWDQGHFIRSYAESIRDRLILWFQLKNLTHKPKLVGITGVTGGEGASTLAGSVAASLSETGDGKVLLVDLNSGRSDAHPFLDGKPAFGLTEALEANGNMPPASENLYVATGASPKNGSKQLAPKQFYALIPTLKASHFDYIIFDLPAVSRSSATLAMAGSLDKLLLVVEAEKSDRDQVKHAYTELVAARANVSAVLNKTREALPA